MTAVFQFIKPEKSSPTGKYNDNSTITFFCNKCYSNVTCKVFIESTLSLLNRPQRKLAQSCANSWHKINRHANRRHVCIVLLCATLNPLKQMLLPCTGEL